jgi:putative urate catabolism protein
MNEYPRDLFGYGDTPPHAQWPGNARIAVNFVVNFEEGGEHNVLHGDSHSEYHLSETPTQPLLGARNLIIESFFEYGSRAGFWRIMRLFRERSVHFTAFAIGMALERNREAAKAMAEAGHEVATHGYRWIDYTHIPPGVEREHILRTIEIHKQVLGERPLGFYQGRCSVNSRRLCVEEGGFLYDADSYADDLPYWCTDYGRPHLVVPYTSDVTDMKFQTTTGSFSCGDQFFNYLKDSFDCLYAEGELMPKMMSVALHTRIIGRPGRFQSLARFLDYVLSHDRVWVARRIDIARHWISTHPPQAKSAEPSQSGRAPAARSRRSRSAAQMSSGLRNSVESHG